MTSYVSSALGEIPTRASAETLMRYIICAHKFGGLLNDPIAEKSLRLTKLVHF